MKEKKERFTITKRHILYKDIRSDIDNIFELEDGELKRFYYRLPLDINLFFGSAAKLDTLDKEIENRLLEHFKISKHRIKRLLYIYLDIIENKQSLPF